MVEHHWNEQDDKQLKVLWRTPASQADIAKTLGFSAPYISIRATQLGLPPRGDVSAETKYYIEEAARRSITLKALKAKILTVIAQSRLIDAVLDDGA